MELLERSEYLTQLNDLFLKVKNSEGQIVAICGEAGIGKTSLVESFTHKFADKVKVYTGFCDNLFTPRPLAPLYDIADQMNSRIITQLDSAAPRPSIFTNFMKELQLKEPNIVIVEDIHWADESSLDLIKFLGRRINQCKTLLIITYRDDEISSEHPLKLLLGNLPTKYFRRIKLTPLSKEAVKILAKSFGIDKDIYSKTGGNPFLVTEVLSNDQNETPSTVKDLINYKLTQLSAEARHLIEFLSVIPGKTEKWFVKELIKNFIDIDEAIESGILKIEDGTISFRHELARIAVEESLPESKIYELNSMVLKILVKQKNINHSLARIIHHAAKADSWEFIIKYAPLAAKQASKLGAHEQAAMHYLTALRYVDYLSTEEKLNLLEGRAFECYLTGQTQEGIIACQSIIRIMKSHNNPLREGENFRLLSRILWFDGQDEKGEEYLNKAIEILKKLPVSKQLAMAYSNKSQIFMLRENTELAVKWGEKAIELAKKINDLDVEIHSLNNIGTAKMFAGEKTGEHYLQKSLELAVQNEFHDHIGRAYDNLGTAYLYRRNLSEADKYFSTGIEYCNEKDLNAHGLCMTAEIAKTKLILGNWDEAINLSNMNLSSEHVPIIDKVIPLCVIGTIRARRNDPGALRNLIEAKSLAMKSGEAGKIVSVISALAEAYWLKNNLNQIVDEIDSVYLKIIKTNNSWAIGELAFWLWKAGKLSEIPERIAKPYLFQIKGDWKSAAKLWGELNCVYDQALALADGNEEAMKKAIVLLDRLGASATSQLIKQKMRESGIKNIPKGPRISTKQNPAGLTGRQLEVLKLIANGLSNIEIANNLYISPKTVDHHISAIFAKLNIHSRSEVAALIHSGSLFLI